MGKHLLLIMQENRKLRDRVHELTEWQAARQYLPAAVPVVVSGNLDGTATLYGCVQLHHGSANYNERNCDRKYAPHNQSYTINDENFNAVFGQFRGLYQPEETKLVNGRCVFKRRRAEGEEEVDWFLYFASEPNEPGYWCIGRSGPPPSARQGLFGNTGRMNVKPTGTNSWNQGCPVLVHTGWDHVTSDPWLQAHTVHFDCASAMNSRVLQTRYDVYQRATSISGALLRIASGALTPDNIADDAQSPWQCSIGLGFDTPSQISAVTVRGQMFASYEYKFPVPIDRWADVRGLQINAQVKQGR